MKRITAMLLSGLILLLPGCADAISRDELGIQFYYSVSTDVDTGPAIEAETDLVDQMSVPDLMNRLLEGPISTTLSKTFPEGTILQDWTLQDGALSIDLSEGFGGLSGIALTRAEYCIVLTMAQLDEVETVSITVDGRPLPGSYSGPLSANDVILKGETEDPFNVSSQLYFPLTDHTGLGVEYRVFEVAATDLLTQSNGVLEELLLGPKEEEMATFLNGAGRLEVVEIHDERCVVEMDSVTLGVLCSNEAAFSLYLYALVDSLTELEGITSVSFLLEGSPIINWESSYTAVYNF